MVRFGKNFGFYGVFIDFYGYLEVFALVFYFIKNALYAAIT